MALQRRTPMKRTRLNSNPETTRAWQDRTRKPIPPRSEKREDERPERQALVAEMLAEHPHCAAQIPVICTGRTTEVNELIRRSSWAAGYLVKSNTESLCHNCHAFITHHPGRAGWAARHGHQLFDGDGEAEFELAARIRSAFAGCSSSCLIDHRVEDAQWKL